MVVVGVLVADADDAYTADVQQTAFGAADICVEAKVKNRSTTRDQDELKGNDPDDVVENLNDTIANFHGTTDDSVV